MPRCGPSALAASAVLLTFAPSGALACTAPAPAVYTIRHETYGEIGRHAVEFRCAGAELIVETAIDIEVGLLVVKLYNRRGRYREVWHGDRLIAYQARTEEGDQVFETRARIADDHMTIDGLQQGVEAPLTVVPSHPWNHAVVERDLLFDMKDGGLLRVTTKPAGEETLAIGGRPVVAQKYVVSGDLQRELWYDEAGNWLQWRLYNDGNAVTMTRQ